MTEVALVPDTAPRPPAVILQLLEKLGVPCHIRPDHPALAASRRVQAALLDDAVGALLVLFPQNQLLDLNRLAELTGRKLTAVKPERMERMLSKHSLGVLPGLPPLTSSPCLYDERLLQEPSLLVESGQPGVLLEIGSEHYKSILLAKASAARFGEPLASIRPNLDRPDDDRAEITQAVQAFTARRIQQRLEETIEIPPLPETAQKIIKLRVDPDATVDDITGVVETDPALAAQVVSWAASPYYAAPGKIRSVEDAIVRVLGFDLVINLALGLALGKTLSLPKLAGLLHNFGYLVLAHVFPPHFSLICRHLEVNPHLGTGYIEQHLLGITREQIGAWLMRFWDMPEELATALRFQHDPSYDGAHAAYPNLVCLAVNLLRSRGIGSGPQHELPDELFERLGLTRDKAEDALDKVLQAEAALRELASQFNHPH